MIFSKLFNKKAKWQHEDSTIRIEAIDELAADNSENIQLLTRLAQQDKSDLVRRSALLKLDDFNLWFKASNEDKNNSVKQFALEHALSSFITLSHDEKLNGIEKTLPLFFAEALLEHESDDVLLIALIKKINKPQKWPQLYLSTEHQAIKRFIIEQTNDNSLLEKWAKKEKDNTLVSQLNDKLSFLEQEKEKPAKLKKDTQMVLSKLLALKDQHDYQEMLNKRTALDNEWQQLEQDFNYLAQSDVEIFSDKYQTIVSQLDKAFAQQKEIYEQELIAVKLAEQKSEQQNVFTETLTNLDSILADAVFNNEVIDEQEIEKQITEYIEQVNLSVLAEQQKSMFVKQFKEQLNKLNKLSSIAESVTEATHLISRMSQQQPPENIEQLSDKQSFFNEWQKSFNTVLEKASGVLPSSVLDAKYEIVKQWNEALAPLNKERKHLLNQTQRKVSELRRLINQGKYNACFGVYKKFEQLYNQLSHHQQHKLQRDHEFLSAKIAELSDWEHYIATPRKQQLLDEISALAESPLTDIREQANKVKSYRKTWNSLGHADEELDKSLNQSFNDACEKAFAPCRNFYAEQEKQRALHLVQRQEVVDKAVLLAEEVSSDSVDMKQLESKFNKLNQAWREAGDVDRNVYNEINSAFLKAINPIKDAIYEYHKANIALKKDLISQVKSEQENSDIFAAVKNVKALQSEWKKVGYAGAQKENQLWQEFRQENDVIFAMRDETKRGTQAEISDRIKACKPKLEQLKQDIEQATNATQFSSLEEQLKVLLKEQLSDKPVIKQLTETIEGYITQVEKKQQQFAKEELTQSWQHIFSLLDRICDQSIHIEDLKDDDEYKMIRANMQKKLSDALAKVSNGDRKSKTIELEILSGVASPKTDESQRMEIQVKLMQEKMTSGSNINLEQAFFEWLSAAPIHPEDQPLIQRVRHIYIK